jgi:glycerate-2-kinase
MKRPTTVFSLGSLACEFQRIYILLSGGGTSLIFYPSELIEKLSKFR